MEGSRDVRNPRRDVERRTILAGFDNLTAAVVESLVVTRLER